MHTQAHDIQAYTCTSNTERNNVDTDSDILDRENSTAFIAGLSFNSDCVNTIREFKEVNLKNNTTQRILCKVSDRCKSQTVMKARAYVHQVWGGGVNTHERKGGRGM